MHCLLFVEAWEKKRSQEKSFFSCFSFKAKLLLFHVSVLQMSYSLHYCGTRGRRRLIQAAVGFQVISVHRRNKLGEAWNSLGLGNPLHFMFVAELTSHGNAIKGGFNLMLIYSTACSLAAGKLQHLEYERWLLNRILFISCAVGKIKLRR